MGNVPSPVLGFTGPPTGVTFVGAGLVLTVFLHAACNRSPRRAAGSGPIRGGTLNLVVVEALEGLDPRSAVDAYSQRITRLVFATAREMVSAAEAESPTILLLRLRTDAFFHDDPCFAEGRGRRVTADDLAYTIDRLAAPESDAYWVVQNRLVGAAERHRGDSDRVSGIEVVDDATIRLRLTRPFYPMLDVLGLEQCGVVPREAVARYGERFRYHPVGSGPFRLAKWIEGDELILVRHRRYRRRDAAGRALPYLERIRMRYVRPALGQWNEFIGGRIDQCRVPDDLARLVVVTDEDGGWKLIPEIADKGWLGFSRPRVSPFVIYLGMDCGTDGPVARSAVLRRALATALDRAELARIAGSDMEAAGGLLPPGFPGHGGRQLLPAYDPEEAGRLLSQAGYPDGKQLPVLSLYTVAGRTTLARAVRQHLERVGVHVDIVEKPFGELLETVRQGKADLFLSGMTSSTFLHPEGFLGAFRSDVGSAVNKVRFRDPGFDSLCALAGATADESQRMARYADAEAALLEQLPIVPLAWATRPTFFVTSHRVHLPDGSPATDLVNAWIEPERG